MKSRLALAFFCAALALAQSTLTWQQLRSLIDSSVKLQQKDKEVATYLRRQKLTFALSDRLIEELQGLGAGIQTVYALRELQKASQGLPAPVLSPVAAAPERVVEPPPSPEDQKRIIEEARTYALSYTKRLPDFICLQLTRRYVDPTGLEMDWMKYDEIKTRLSYFEQKEDYKVISVNEQLTNRSFESLGGTTSTGEFGSMLAELLAPETMAEFSWDRHSVVGGRKAYVFRFRVQQERSHWHISYQRQQDIISAYTGLLYIDKVTSMVLRLSMVTEGMPRDFPVNEARSTLEYGFTGIAGREYLLPRRATVRMREAKVLTRNEVEFRLYRKFSAEASIAFEADAAAAKPEEKPPQQEPPD